MKQIYANYDLFVVIVGEDEEHEDESNKKTRMERKSTAATLKCIQNPIYKPNWKKTSNRLGQTKRLYIVLQNGENYCVQQLQPKEKR